MLKPLIACACVVLLPLVSSALTMDLVTVGNPGNAVDPADGSILDPGIQNFGSVAYTYGIGTYEVQNIQYAEFLNSVAASADPYGLYNAGMGTDARGGITRSGSIGAYTYAVKDNMGEKPVNYVSFYDAVRFVNWLENGQPPGAQSAGTTETGSYTLFTEGSTTTNVSARAANATWVLPTEDEWYKAAYYDPGPSGPSDDWWLYPTQSDSVPSMGLADATGSITNDGSNVANYNQAADWNGQNGNVTTVGSAGPLSASHYGTYDQGGNLNEWNEAIINGNYRGIRGGFFGDALPNEITLQSFFQNLGPPDGESASLGFRVAFIPEPCTLVALGLAGLASCIWCRRRR